MEKGKYDNGMTRGIDKTFKIGESTTDDKKEESLKKVKLAKMKQRLMLG